MTATYAAVADVQARQPGFTIDGSSSPSSTDVQGWLDEAQSTLDLTLQAAQLPAPYTGTDAMALLGVLITNYATGRFEQALASSGGDGGNEDGNDLVAEFKEALADIRRDPVWWGAKLGGGSAPSGSVKMRGTATANVNDPVITMDEVF